MWQEGRGGMHERFWRENLKGKARLEELGIRTWENNISMYLKVARWKGVEWIRID
jgi:hypothetical protein